MKKRKERGTTITAATLRQLGACGKSIRTFKLVFPNGTVIPPPGPERGEFIGKMTGIFTTADVLWFLRRKRLSVAFVDYQGHPFRFVRGVNQGVHIDV